MAKQKGGKRGLSLTFEQLKDWWRISVKVQTQICEAKLHEEEVRSDLRKSGNQILIQPCDVQTKKLKDVSGKDGRY